MTKKFIFGFSIIVILLQFLLIFYIGYIDFIDLQSISSNSLISDNAVTILFKEDSSYPSLKRFINQYPKTTILSEIHNDIDLQVWGIAGENFLNEKTESFVKGGFFQNEDFFQNKYKSVIGKNIISSNKYFIDKNGKEEFKFLGNHYEIIGHLSSNISNTFDNTVFINLDSIDIRLNKFIIDGQNSSDIIAVVEDLKESYNVKLIEGQGNLIDRYLYNSIEQYTFRILIIIFIIILIITLFIFILLHYKEEIVIKRIIGIELKRILLNIYGNIATLILINAIIVGITYIFIYYIFIRNIHINFNFYPVIIFSFTLLFIICFLLYLYMVTSKNLSIDNEVK